MRETGTSLNNSVAYNVEKDDPCYFNYLCLYSVIKSKIINDKNFADGVRDIKRDFGLIENKEKIIRAQNKGTYRKKRDHSSYRTKYKYHDIKVEDTETGEIFKFNNVVEVGEYLNSKPSALNAYIRNGHKYKKRYKITAKKLDTMENYNFKVVVSNVKTGEVEEFKTVTAAADYIDVRVQNMTYLNKTQKPNKNGWKVEYIEGD